MIYKYNKNIPARLEIQEINVSPCVDCDCNFIKINCYDDQFGSISSAVCTKCNKEIKCNGSELVVISKWNSVNDPDAIIMAMKKQISEANAKITAMEQLKNHRRANEHTT